MFGIIRSSTSIKSSSVPSIDSPVVTAAVVCVTNTLHKPSRTPDSDTHRVTRSVMSSTCLSRRVEMVSVIAGMRGPLFEGADDRDFRGNSFVQGTFISDLEQTSLLFISERARQ